jgi:hypothetical protein
MVGIGSQFAADGKVNDFSGVSQITFWMKASAMMTIVIEIATKDVVDYGYYFMKADVGLDWSQYTLDPMEFISFTQPSWADPVDFSADSVQKIQWKISADEDCPATGTLWIDDVELVLKPGTVCPIPGLCPNIGPAGIGTPATGAMLGDLEAVGKKKGNQNATNYYWYAYNDAQNRTPAPALGQFSTIIGGVKPDPLDPTVVDLFLQPGTGHAASTGAFIDFTLGPTFAKGVGPTAEIIQPFVGVGTMLSDNLGLSFYNAATDGATGIYFDYMLKGADFLRMEVIANQNFGNPGIVHHCYAPGSPTGAWFSVNVPFAELVLPNWDEVIALPPTLTALKTTELVKIQWAVQGTAGTKAQLSVDNVRLVGATAITPSSIKSHSRAGSHRLKITVQPNAIIVNYPMAKMRHAQVRLANSAGVVIDSRTNNRGAGIVFNSSNLGTGIYFVSLSGISNNGESLNLRKAITLLK